MNNITIDRESLIPRFLGTYMTELPEDICSLRLWTVLLIVMLTFAAFVVGMGLFGTFLLADVLFTSTLAWAVVASTFYTLSFVLALSVWFFGTCLVLALGIFKGVKWIIHKQVDHEVAGEPLPAPLRTVDTIKEMYKSLKDKYCVYIDYK